MNVGPSSFLPSLGRARVPPRSLLPLIQPTWHVPFLTRYSILSHLMSSFARNLLLLDENPVTPRRKNRRKTVILHDLPRGTQSLSESAFGTPSPSLFHASLPPGQLPRLQTSSNQLGYNNAAASSSTLPGPPSPSRRASSGRNATVHSSPAKKQASVIPGKITAAMNSDTIMPSDVVQGLRSRGKGRGIPRTLTLPAHLTESLLKMTLTREGSSDPMGAHAEEKLRLEGVEGDEMEVDGTDDVDGRAGPLKPALKLLTIRDQGTEPAIQEDQQEEEHPPRSPKKPKRRRARSLPLRRPNPHEDPCEGDDEETEREEDEGDYNSLGPLGPAPPPRRRGRSGVGIVLPMPIAGSDEALIEITMSGVPTVISSVPRRSARRGKPARRGGSGPGSAGLPPPGGATPFLKERIAEGDADAGSGMEITGDFIVSKDRVSRKRSRTKLVAQDTGLGGLSGMEAEVAMTMATTMATTASRTNVPRKRARTREGGDRERERVGRDVEEGQRAAKRTRKR